MEMGAVMPSGKVLARTMARYVDPNSKGPIIELGPGTGPVTDAMIEAASIPRGSCWSSSTRSSAGCCRRAIREATVVQGDAYSLQARAGRYSRAAGSRRSCPACR